jgi:hypothetical protein
MHDQLITPAQPLMPGQPAAAGRAARRILPGLRARTIAVATLLSAAAVAWAAVPLSAGGSGTRPLLVAAVCCAALAAVRLSMRPVEPDIAAAFAPDLVRAWWRVTDLIRMIPWAEAAIVATLGLEARHPSRPWHTAVLGAALLAYLFAMHLTETGESARSLRPQLPMIAAGLGLLALAAAAAALPAGTGTGPGWLRVLAATAAVVVGALIVPI